MKWYLVHTKSDCDPDAAWRADVERSHKCPRCHCLDDSYLHGSVDAYILDPPDAAAVNNVFPPGIGLARVDFLELFRDEVAKYLHLGRVYVKDRFAGTPPELVSGFVSYAASRRMPLRGGKDSIFRGRCPQCNRWHYLPRYPWHLLRRDLFDHPLTEAWPQTGLILNEELRARIKPGKWKGIYITELPVLDEPADGFDLGPEPLIVRGLP